MEPTTRQLEILALSAQGFTREEIGQQMGYSPWTVKRRLDELRELVEARNTSQAIVTCIARGYLCVDGRAERVFIPEPIAVAA